MNEWTERFELIVTATGMVATAVFSAVAAIVSKKVKRQTESIEDAVNHRHKRENGSELPKLYDAVLGISQSIVHLHDRTDKIDNKVDLLADDVTKLKQRPPCSYHDETKD